MRLLTKKKIYRAYPELDPFDDAICKKYVRHARRSGRAWLGRGLIVIVIPVALLLWLIFIIGMGWATRSIDISDSVLWVAIGMVIYTGIFWFPALCALLVRDITLRRIIRKRLDVTGCESCGYNLIGLTVFDDSDSRVVQCPECGTKTTLNQGHISEADINPALLAET